MISSHENEPLIGWLSDQGIPTVACGIPLGYDGPVSSVSVDEAGGARAMVRHLRESGRRRIATIAGPQDTPGGRYRLEGYRAELGDLYDERYVAYGDYSSESGHAAMTELLERVPDLDAVFAASDTMAASALVALRHSGRRVPQDVAVGGFDDSGLAETLDPPLSTMHQPFDRISAEMVDLLLDQIAGTPPKSVTMPTHSSSEPAPDAVHRPTARRLSARHGSVRAAAGLRGRWSGRSRPAVEAAADDDTQCVPARPPAAVGRAVRRPRPDVRSMRRYALRRR